MSLYACGNGTVNGELGDERTYVTNVPIQIDGLGCDPVVSVYANEHSAAVITESGEVLTWGRNREGELGTGSCEFHVKTPQLVNTLRPERIVTMAVGYHHMVAVNAQGHVFEWGKLYTIMEEVKTYFGSLITLPGLHKEKRIDLVTRSNTEYYANGLKDIEKEDSNANLNFANFTAYIQRVPKIIPSLAKERIVKVAAGYGFTLALNEKGELFSWGINDKFQLGIGHRFNQHKPVKVASLSGIVITDIACGQQHSLVLSNQGDIYSWGLGVFGQLGHSNIKSEFFPKKIEIEGSTPHFVAIACGSLHSLALDDRGKVWSWGNAEYGQQGGLAQAEATMKENGHSVYRTVPQIVAGNFDGQKVVKIACGNLHNLAINKDGSVFAWGWGAHGMLGIGHNRLCLYPEMIDSLKGEVINTISAGVRTSYFSTEKSPTSFAYVFREFVNNKKYSDVTIKVKNAILHGHRVIILNRCSYLRGLDVFNKKLTGQHISEFDFKDVEQNVFIALLYYLYTDKLKAAYHLTPKIEALARKLQLPRLVALCKHDRWLRGGKMYGESVSIPPSTWSSDFVYDGLEAYSDFTIECDDGQKFTTHKLFLYSRSGYFKTLFNSSFFKNDAPSHLLHDVKSEDLFLTLKWIYTRYHDDIQSDNILDVLYSSCRILVDDLKLYLEALIEESIDDENVFHLLNISLETDSARLRRSCHAFILRNLEEYESQIEEAEKRYPGCISSLKSFCEHTGNLDVISYLMKYIDVN